MASKWLGRVMRSHTGLGEEGGETVVVLGGLALLGEVAIGLYHVSVLSMGSCVCSARTWIPCSRQYSYIPIVSVSSSHTQAAVFPSDHLFLRVFRSARVGVLTSQQELAIWQPAWPTIRVECQ
jgi:hypothetical protein